MKVPSHKHTGTWADVPSSWKALPCHEGTSTRSADPAKQRHREGHTCHFTWILLFSTKNITFSPVPHFACNHMLLTDDFTFRISKNCDTQEVISTFSRAWHEDRQIILISDFSTFNTNCIIGCICQAQQFNQYLSLLWGEKKEENNTFACINYICVFLNVKDFLLHN